MLLMNENVFKKRRRTNPDCYFEHRASLALKNVQFSKVAGDKKFKKATHIEKLFCLFNFSHKIKIIVYIYFVTKYQPIMFHKVLVIFKIIHLPSDMINLTNQTYSLTDSLSQLATNDQFYILWYAMAFVVQEAGELQRGVTGSPIFRSEKFY